MRFIDDSRLLGVVPTRPCGLKEVVLWDAAVLGDTRIPRQLVFDLGPPYAVPRLPGLIIDIACDLESNHAPPFRADPSMQLVGIKVSGDYTNHRWYPRDSKVLLIRSQDLSGFASRIGTTSTIRWEDWSPFVRQILIWRLLSAEVHLLHSHLVCLHESCLSNPPYLRAFDLSIERKRREGDSGSIGEYSERAIPDCRHVPKRTLYLSTSNIVFGSSSTHGLVSSTPLGTLLASSGLTVTPPSP